MSMGLDPLRDVRGVGIDQYRAGLGEYLDAVASDAWANSPISALGRMVDVADAEVQARRRGDQLLSPTEASELGRDIGLRFESSIAQSAYDILADTRREQIAAESVYRRARAEGGYGTIDWLLGGGAEFLAMAVDPLNIASAFVPVVGPARYALWAERFGALPAALARGALEGVAGQAMLEPVMAVDAGVRGSEYGMLDTLVNLAFGAGLGTVLHGAGYGAGAGFRFIRDRYVVSTRAAPAPESAGTTGERVPAREELSAPAVEREASPPPRQPVAEAMETLRPETRDAAMRTAIAQLVQDKPVDVEPVLKADPRYRDSWEISRADYSREIEELQRRSVQATAAVLPTVEPPPEYRPSAEEFELARRVSRGWTPERELARPQSLVDFVRKNGGLIQGTPEAAELLAADIGRQPGLLRSRERGRQADHMAQAAADAGYRFGPETATGSGVDVDAFVKALIEDASGRAKAFPADAHTSAWRAQQEYFSAFRANLEDLGLEPKGMDPRQIAWLLRQDQDTARLMSLLSRIDELGPDSSLELAARLDAERAALEREILSEEPGAVEPDAATADHRDIPAATLEELERYYADLERAAGPQEPGGQAAGRPAVAGRPGEGGEAAPARPGRDTAPPEGAGLRRPAGEERSGAAEQGTAPDLTGELAGWAERQQRADLHADPAALAVRDDRLAAEAREVQQLLADDMATYGHLLDQDTRLLFDTAGALFDSEASAISALATCQMEAR